MPVGKVSVPALEIDVFVSFSQVAYMRAVGCTCGWQADEFELVVDGLELLVGKDGFFE